MSDEEALLSAIAANPAEDTPRLVYADWLDEHDHHIRAEFVRLQIDIAGKQETLPRALLNRHVDLFKRQQELIDNHLNQLLGPLVEINDQQIVIDDRPLLEFHRGFLSEVSLEAEQFLRHADAIAALKPLPDVKVWNIAARLDDLSNISHHMELVTTAEMQSLREPITLTAAEVWNIFVESWPWSRLKTLNLVECGIGDHGLRGLGSAHENLTQLVDLDLYGNDITVNGVLDLVRSPLLPQLHRLILSRNPIGDVGAMALAAGWPVDSRLDCLTLRHTNIGPPGQEALLARFGRKVHLDFE